MIIKNNLFIDCHIIISYSKGCHVGVVVTRENGHNDFYDIPDEEKPRILI